MSDKLKIGDRVRYSPHGLESLNRPQRMGTVTGNTRKPELCVAVRWDNQKCASNYARSFIERENNTLTLSGVNIAEEEKHWIWRHDFANPAKHAEMEQVWGRMAERAREWHECEKMKHSMK